MCSRRPPAGATSSASAQSFYQEAWWFLVFPALILVITTVAFNLLGDGVRDAMDPRTERVFAAGRGRKRRKLASLAAGPAPSSPIPAGSLVAGRRVRT